MRNSCSCRSATCTGRPGCDAVAHDAAIATALDGLTKELDALGNMPTPGHYGRNLMSAQQHLEKLRALTAK